MPAFAETVEGRKQFAAQASVVHLHPTLTCNLTCSHCYSSSSPHTRQSLDPDVVIGCLEALQREGYGTLSISGGEPLLYPHLDAVANGAHAVGMRVHVITNGTVALPRYLSGEPGLVDLVAVSLDGAAARHNRIRGRDWAFSRAVDTIRELRSLGLRVAVVSCVTRGSLAEIPELYELCQREGVALLSLRPIVAVGRGRDLLTSQTDEGLAQSDLMRLRILAEILDTDEGPRVRADVTFAGELRAQANVAYPFLEPAALDGPGAGSSIAAISPLVIDADGGVFPFVYGMPASYALGSLDHGPGGLVQGIRELLPDVARLVAAAYDALPDENGFCLDWYSHLLEIAHERVPSGVARPAR